MTIYSSGAIPLTSANGVYLDIYLDYDATLTGYNVTIVGDFDILDNVFNMVTTDGITIEDIYVNELNGGRMQWAT